MDMLITGGAGFVGSNLARFFASQNSIIVADVVSPAHSSTSVPWIKLDVTDEKKTLSVIRRVSPQVVIHAAGNKDVRYCEKYPARAYRVNALGTQNVARACKAAGAKMIYLSTDLVFACDGGHYKETDTPHPTLVYGKTKLQGEKLAMQELNDVAICRSGGVYGRGAPLLSWLLGELKAGRTVECFTDVYNTPTYVDNLKEMCQIIIERSINGIFHTVGLQRINRFCFFREFASVFNLDDSLLKPIPAGMRRQEMLLLPDSSLSIKKTAAKLGIIFNSVSEGFVRLKASGGI
jgi:dTDP-4-dehydrorhamnose reductase